MFRQTQEMDENVWIRETEIIWCFYAKLSKGWAAQRVGCCLTHTRGAGVFPLQRVLSLKLQSHGRAVKSVITPKLGSVSLNKSQHRNTYGPAWVWQSEGGVPGCHSSCSCPALSGRRAAGRGIHLMSLCAMATLSRGWEATPQVFWSGRTH